MNATCQDRDLLAVEPVIFLGSGLPAQTLLTGSGGTIAGAHFTATGVDFTAALRAGMVLCVWTTTAAEGSAYEIVSVDAAGQLTVSVLRPSLADTPIAPPAGAGLHFHVRSYQPQLQAVANELGEKLRILSEAAGIDAADYVDCSQLRTAQAYGALAAVFRARADNSAATDANWIKAEFYRQLFRTQQLQLRLAIDADGDGQAEFTRTLGNVSLRRV